jgi:hypothetical protein
VILVCGVDVWEEVTCGGQCVLTFGSEAGGLYGGFSFMNEKWFYLILYYLEESCRNRKLFVLFFYVI